MARGRIKNETPTGTAAPATAPAPVIPVSAGSITYQVARIAAESQCDARTVLAALHERDYSATHIRARVAKTIDALGWDREQLERDAATLKTRQS